MTDLTEIRINATAETALKKLKRAEIGVYNCKKDRVFFIFSVKDKDIKKVFAIFSSSCYNIRIENQSAQKKLSLRLFNRLGLLFGAFLFIAAAIVSNMFVLKISVGGSGSYLENEIKSIIYESGAKEFSLCRSFDASAATGRILAMPNVTFCNIEKRGSILHIDVQTDYEYDKTPQKSSLYADVNGTVKKITAVCGTPLVNVGDKVKKGDCLIAAFIVSGDKTVNSLAAGYVELESSGKSEYFAESESDQSLKDAYASVLIDEKDIISRKFTVKPAEGGVIYIIDFTYLHMLSINME